MISVLLSAHEESSNTYFWQTIESVRTLQSLGHKIEVIVGISPGRDETLERLKKDSVKFIELTSPKRADRYNAALKYSDALDGDWIILHHPRSLLQIEAFLALEKLPHPIQWGAFTHEFDFDHPLLKFTSWWSNSVRGDIKKIFYLDHCLFVRKGLMNKIKGIPSVEIFEDTILSQLLLNHAQPLRLPWKGRTSAIRFLKNGLWRQAILNQILKIQFYSGAKDEGMNTRYEKGISLNKPEV